MCGRFALGVESEQVRLGIAAHFGSIGRVRRRGEPNEEEDEAYESMGRLRGGGSGGEPVVAESEAGPSRTPLSSQSSVDDLIQDATALSWPNEDKFRSNNYNVAPRSHSVVLRLKKGKGKAAATINDLQLDTMQWGLIPHWSKHPPSGPLNTINARSENLIDSSAGGMWQSLKGHKRCLIPVDGYYEWQKKGGGTKIPHFTRLPTWDEMDAKHAFATSVPYPSGTSSDKDNSTDRKSIPRFMFLAGLFDTVKYVDCAPEDPPIVTFTILTTTPSKSLEFLHDRMPVILEDEDECLEWLDNETGWTEKLAALLRPYEGEVKCYAVQPEVGKIGNNSSSFVLPVAERKDGVASFFKKQVVKEEKKPDVDGSSMALKGESKPVKASGDRKVHSPPTTSVKTEPASHDQKPNKRPSEKVKVLDDGIGDDSNAPNKKRKVEATMSKAKKEEDASDDDDDEVEVIPDPGPPKRQTRSSKAGPPSKAHRPATGQSGGSPQSGQASLDSFLK